MDEGREGARHEEIEGEAVRRQSLEREEKARLAEQQLRFAEASSTPSPRHQTSQHAAAYYPFHQQPHLGGHQHHQPAPLALTEEQRTDWINLQRANPSIALPSSTSRAATPAGSDAASFTRGGGTAGYVSPSNVTVSPLAPLVSNEPYVGYLSGCVWQREHERPLLYEGSFSASPTFSCDHIAPLFRVQASSDCPRCRAPAAGKAC
jgi:hypothetical protein